MATRWTDRAAAAGVIALALALPLAASPFVTDTSFATRLVVAAAGIGLACLAPGRSRLPAAVGWALLAAVGTFVAAALAGATPLLSLLGRFPRYEGLVTVLGYAGALVAGARLLGPGRAGLRGLFCSASSVAAVATAVQAVVQAVSHPDERVTALLGNSSVLGTWAAIVCCLLGGQLLVERRVLWGAGFAASLLAVALSASRGAIVALTAAFVVASLVRPLTTQRPPRWAPLALAGVLGASAWLLPSVRIRLTGATPFADATASGRVLLWSDSWRLVAGNPLLGVGPSRFVDAIGGFHTREWAAAVGPYAPPDSPHNLVLQVLGSTGLAGLAGTVALLAVVAVGLWRRRPWDAWTTGAVLAASAAGVSYLFSYTEPLTTTVALACLGGALAEPGATAASGSRPVQVRRDGHAARPGTVVAVLGCTWAAVAQGLAGTVLAAEARFSAAVTSAAPTTGDLLAAGDVRPRDPDLTRRIGYTVARLAEQGLADPAPAVPAVAEACRVLVSSTECLLTLGDLQEFAGDPAASVRTLTEALSLDPTNVDSLLKRGIAHASVGDAAAAERDFTRASELRPTAPEPWDNLAVLYTRLGRDDAATEASAKAEGLRR